MDWCRDAQWRLLDQSNRSLAVYVMTRTLITIRRQSIKFLWLYHDVTTCCLLHEHFSTRCGRKACTINNSGLFITTVVQLQSDGDTSPWKLNMFRMNCLVVLELIKVTFASSNLSEMSCFVGFLAIREAIWKGHVVDCQECRWRRLFYLSNQRKSLWGRVCTMGGKGLWNMIVVMPSWILSFVMILELIWACTHSCWPPNAREYKCWASRIYRGW